MPDYTPGPTRTTWRTLDDSAVTHRGGTKLLASGVDLRWAAWAQDRDFWGERGHGDVIAALDHLLPGQSLRVESAPYKEIRYATVDIIGHAERVEVFVSLREEWDAKPDTETDAQVFIPWQDSAELTDAILAAVDAVEEKHLARIAGDA